MTAGQRLRQFDERGFLGRFAILVARSGHSRQAAADREAPLRQPYASVDATAAGYDSWCLCDN
jgi:hypothetical protein